MDPLQSLNFLQVLDEPKPELVDIDHAFGGIGIFAGMNADAIKKLTAIARFRSMGDAQFEFGVIPASLKAICIRSRENILHEMVVQGKIVYVIIPSTHAALYNGALEEVAKGDYSGCSHRLYSTLTAADPKGLPVGWLDIRNNVFIFIQKEMAEKMYLFLVGAPVRWA